ncbi:MAG: hypothetical protein LBC77_05585 [Spirochaetaceae bacterium]|jgi:hypothetical protein|nr:hypothetical protein [Spirochaetaceae bacterium]
MAQMVYLARKNDKVVFHTSQEEMLKVDGVSPEYAVTLAEFEAAGSLIRIIGGKIVVGKTSAEKAREAEAETLAAEKAELLAELAGKDYKVVKAAEAGLVLAQADPSLHRRREECRARINEIEARLAALA